MRAPVRIMLLASLVLAIAACSSADAGDGLAATDRPQPTSQATAEATGTPEPAGEPTPGTSLDACEIITPDDIAAATDTSDVAAGTLEASPTVLSPGRTECTYAGDFGRILVELTPEDGANLYDAAAGAYKDAEEIPGLGDGAFNSDQNKRAFVWKGSVTIMLTMFLGGDLEQADVAAALGEAMLAKL